MSNFMGKTLLGAKKLGKAVGKSAGEIGATIGKSASEIGATIGGAASELSDYTKKVAKVSMLKAEMDELYLKLGHSAFEDGLTPDNAEAMEIMNKLYELDAQVVEMEKVIKASQDARKACSCDSKTECTCDGECHCEETTVDVEDVKSEDTDA